MNSVALLIGGNQGDRHRLIEQATELIRERIGSVVASSRLYETEPWGDFGDDRPQDFLNQALLVETELGPHETLCQALAIESLLGRQRPPLITHHSSLNTQHSPLPALHSPLSTLHSPLSTPHYSSRPMDIDLIFWNDETIDTPDLIIPHPRMHLRRFVLEPLAEIMPHYRHPLLGLTVEELLDRVD